MIPDRLQDFFKHFRIDEASTKSGPSGPVFITKTFENIQEKYGGMLGNIIFEPDNKKSEMDLFQSIMYHVCSKPCFV